MLYKLRTSLKPMIFPFQEHGVYIGGNSDNPEDEVVVNGTTFHADSALETISIFVASFLAFINTCHSLRQEHRLLDRYGLITGF